MPVTLISKQFVAETKTDTAERSVTAIISTGAIDRDSEILVPRGADFNQYLKNPVVLWAHDYWSQPIGRAMWIKRQGNSIIAKMQFADTQEAEDVYQLFKGGFLSAFSVGFRVLDSREPTVDDIKKYPEWKDARRVFVKWELLEFSVVPVPANPEALVQAVKSKQIELRDDTRKMLNVEEVEAVDDVEIFLPIKTVEVEEETTSSIEVEPIPIDVSIEVEPVEEVKTIDVEDGTERLSVKMVVEEVANALEKSKGHIE